MARRLFDDERGEHAVWRRPYSDDDLDEEYLVLANEDDFRHAGWTQPGTQEHSLAKQRDELDAYRRGVDEQRRRDREEEKKRRGAAVANMFSAMAEPFQRRR